MVTRHVVVEEYDEGWERDFRAIEAEVRSAVGELAVRVEHVGSTSVPGLAAKPVIDLDVVIRDRSAKRSGGWPRSATRTRATSASPGARRSRTRAGST